LLRKHWHVEIPEEIAALISADPHVEPLVHRIEEEIWPAENPALTTASLRWLLDRSAGEDFFDRVRLLAGSIFVPAIEDFALVRLPSAFSHFYAGVRALRLAWRCVSLPWRRLWGREAENA
jgi:hypothetical protein